MDKLISKLTALGVPGLVLLVAVHTTGLAGGAVILAALASLGPGGIIGGIVTLGLIGLIAEGLSEYGMDSIARGVVGGLLKGGYSPEEIMKTVNKYPISKAMKHSIEAVVRKYAK